MKFKIPFIGAIVAVPLLVIPLIALADHSLPVVPVDAHESTPHKSCQIETNLSQGTRGVAVMCLQEHLIAEGLLKIGAPTGYFGDMTKAAVTEWQSEKGVAPTGFFGAHSREIFSGHHEDTAKHVSAVETHTEAHPAIDVAQWPSVPSVAIKVNLDAMSGYNLEIVTQNFRFAPEHASSQALPNEGHAHLMVNGKKLARVYGNWFHLPAEALQSGQNEVLITLNANDHSDLQQQGSRIEAKQIITK